VSIPTEDPDGEDLTLLTVSDFLRIAADRGKRLWTGTRDGLIWMTDGRRRYVLPDLEGPLPSSLVESLCDRFDLPRSDFALNPAEDG
jgi:hypothetical protein